MQQYVVERVAAHERRLDEDAEIIDDFILPGEGFQLLRADLVFEFEIALGVAYDRHDAKIAYAAAKNKFICGAPEGPVLA